MNIAYRDINNKAIIILVLLFINVNIYVNKFSIKSYTYYKNSSYNCIINNIEFKVMTTQFETLHNQLQSDKIVNIDKKNINNFLAYIYKKGVKNVEVFISKSARVILL